MDETDPAISLMLLRNSRTPYRALAKALNLSVNAVHRRVQDMQDAGIIRGFTARPSLGAAGAMQVYIFGTSRAEPLRDVPAKLSSKDSIFWVGQAGGGYLYVGAYLKNGDELSKLTEFIKETAEMPSPRIGVISGPETYSPPKREMDTLDWQIIDRLREDSRRSIADVAAEVSTATRTMRRRLKWMVDEEQIELTTRWYPDASDDIISIFHVKRAPTDMRGLYELCRRFSPNLLFPIPLMNVPEETLFFSWTRTMKELKDLRGKIEAEPDVTSVSMNILYTGDIYPTWIDELPKRRDYAENRT